VFYQDHMDTGGWIFMTLVGVVLVGLLVAFIVWLAQDQRRRPHRDHYIAGGSAAEILDRRLATGEISVAEYERMKATLATPASPPPPSSTEQATPPT